MLISRLTLTHAIAICIAALTAAPPLVQGIEAAMILNAGDTISPEIFTGTVGSSAGNPNADGQGWYRYNLTSKLNYYNDLNEPNGFTGPRWATSASPGSYPAYLTYALVTTGTTQGSLRLRDSHNAPGVSWICTAAIAGTYEISFDSFSTSNGAGNAFTFNFGIRRSNGTWETLSAVLSGANTTGGTYSGQLQPGDAIGFRSKSSQTVFSTVNATLNGVAVTLLPEPASLALASVGALLIVRRNRRSASLLAMARPYDVAVAKAAFGRAAAKSPCVRPLPGDRGTRRRRRFATATFTASR